MAKKLRAKKEDRFAAPLPFLTTNFSAYPINTVAINEFECDHRGEIRSSYLVIVIRPRLSETRRRERGLLHTRSVKNATSNPSFVRRTYRMMLAASVG
jgi:hypothetical protein